MASGFSTADTTVIVWSKVFTSFQNDPQTASLQSALAYDESGQLLFGRHYSFVQELAVTNIMTLWESVSVPTLLLWGRGDYIATEEDQQIIEAALVQREVPVSLVRLDTDHYWREAADFQTAYRNLREGTKAPVQQVVHDSIVAWLKRVS